jgi:hypothetical protein
MRSRNVVELVSRRESWPRRACCYGQAVLSCHAAQACTGVLTAQCMHKQIAGSHHYLEICYDVNEYSPHCNGPRAHVCCLCAGWFLCHLAWSFRAQIKQARRSEQLHRGALWQARIMWLESLGLLIVNSQIGVQRSEAEQHALECCKDGTN